MPTRREDPVLISARREAIVVFFIWLAAMLYTVGYCYVFGYNRDPESIRYYAGMPDWVFIGLFVPWTACTIASFWVSNFFIRDEDLGDEQPEEDLTAGATSEEPHD